MTDDRKTRNPVLELIDLREAVDRFDAWLRREAERFKLNPDVHMTYLECSEKLRELGAKP